MKSILLIGLGRFGRHMAQKFNELNQEVLAVDIDEERVNDILPFVTDAQIGDSTSEAFLSSLGVRNFDLCVVAIGDDFQSSLETTSLLKDLGAQFVLARASRDVHAKFLLRNGADAIIYPERIWPCALPSSTAPTTFSTISASRRTIPSTRRPFPCGGSERRSYSSPSARNTTSTCSRSSTATMTWSPLPSPDHVFRGDERMLILGRNKDIERFLQL